MARYGRALIVAKFLLGAAGGAALYVAAFLQFPLSFEHDARLDLVALLVIGGGTLTALLLETRVGEWLEYWLQMSPRPDREPRWEKRARRKKRSEPGK